MTGWAYEGRSRRRQSSTGDGRPMTTLDVLTCWATSCEPSPGCSEAEDHSLPQSSQRNSYVPFLTLDAEVTPTAFSGGEERLTAAAERVDH